MLIHLINIVKNMLFFTGSYSNNVFLEPLSAKEEEKYVKLMLDGDVNARNKLIEHNLRLVAHIVKKFDIHHLLSYKVTEKSHTKQVGKMK